MRSRMRKLALGGLVICALALPSSASAAEVTYTCQMAFSAWADSGSSGASLTSPSSGTYDSRTDFYCPAAAGNSGTMSSVDGRFSSLLLQGAVSGVFRHSGSLQLAGRSYSAGVGMIVDAGVARISISGTGVSGTGVGVLSSQCGASLQETCRSWGATGPVQITAQI